MLTNINTDIVKEYINRKERIEENFKLSQSGSIDLLELFLKLHKAYDAGIIELLKMIQLYRSKNIAHFKPSEPNEKIVEYFHTEKKSYKEILDEIFINLIRALDTLEKSFL